MTPPSQSPIYKWCPRIEDLRFFFEEFAGSLALSNKLTFLFLILMTKPLCWFDKQITNHVKLKCHGWTLYQHPQQKCSWTIIKIKHYLFWLTRIKQTETEDILQQFETNVSLSKWSLAPAGQTCPSHVSNWPILMIGTTTTTP